MSHPLFDKHHATLDGALKALASRGYWTPYPESPSPRNYGESANAEAKARFDAQLNRSFVLDQPGTIGRVGAEVSPFGFALGIKYPKADIDTLLAATRAAMPAWRKAGIAARTGICLEILDRINKHSFDIAHSVMHTTGQPFVMAFQAAGPNAQDRGLEAVACAYDEMTRVPGQARWEKPQGKGEPVRLDKRYTVVPRGVGLVIGCSTFPTWNGYPGIFADLAAANAVIVKPHPNAILPLAISVRIAREVIQENGLDPNIIVLAADEPSAPITQALATRPEIALIDYTGGPAFGDWLEKNARQAMLFAEKAGVNFVVIDSTADLKGLVQNLAFSLSLYSGQMCTTPQNIFMPKGGIDTDQGHLGFDDVARAIAGGIERLLSDPARAVELLGAIQSKATLERIDRAAREGHVVLASRAIQHPQFAGATVQTPILVKVDAKREDVYMKESFGPVAYVIATDSTEQSLGLAMKGVRNKGALTGLVHATDPRVIDDAIEAAADVGVALSCNLTGGVYVNQSAAFSDFHATGCNPAANASLTDAAFVVNRFHIVQARMPAVA